VKFTTVKVQFNTVILKFNERGEKTGWTYIEIPADVASRLKPSTKKSFRVKGKLDDFPIHKVALLPMGEGVFIIPLNAQIRKGIGKRQGAMLRVELEEDLSPILLDAEMMECLADEPAALGFFKQLPKSHQQYFSKWIASAKTEATKAKRIAATINGLSQGWNFPQILRSLQAKRRS